MGVEGDGVESEQGYCGVERNREYDLVGVQDSGWCWAGFYQMWKVTVAICFCGVMQIAWYKVNYCFCTVSDYCM